jgi:hypothetical protein
MVFRGGELGAHLIGFGCAEASAEGEGFLPVQVGLAVVAGGQVTACKAVVGTCPLKLVAYPRREAKRGNVLGAGIFWPSGGEEYLAKAIAGVGFMGGVAEFAAQGKRLPVVVSGQLVMAPPHFDLAQPRERARLSGSITDLTE